MGKKKAISYKDAIEEIESIVEELESEDIDIDQLAAQSEKAAELIKICQAKLSDADEKVKAVLSDLSEDAQDND